MKPWNCLRFGMRGRANTAPAKGRNQRAQDKPFQPQQALVMWALLCRGLGEGIPLAARTWALPMASPGPFSSTTVRVGREILVELPRALAFILPSFNRLPPSFSSLGRPLVSPLWGTSRWEGMAPFSSLWNGNSLGSAGRACVWAARSLHERCTSSPRIFKAGLKAVFQSSRIYLCMAPFPFLLTRCVWLTSWNREKTKALLPFTSSTCN